MVEHLPPEDSEGMESASSGHLHYRSIVIIIPPLIDKEGNVLSLLSEIDQYGYFIHQILEAVSLYQPIEFMDDSVKILDVADLQLSFTEEEDLLIYYKILERVVRKMTDPLICMSTMGSSVEVAIPDVVLAEETEDSIGVDVALFNVPQAEYIWEDITSKLSYIVGPGDTRYHLRNILENANKGALLSAEEILEPLLDEQETRRNP